MAEPLRVSLTVNGTHHTNTVEPRLLLVHHLRDTLGLTGTHVGCDTSSCGACTVLVDGESVKSCTLLAVQCEGAEVTTIEGLGSEGDLHPLRSEEHTSELQSRQYLVCRLLLEKKKKNF